MVYMCIGRGNQRNCLNPSGSHTNRQTHIYSYTFSFALPSITEVGEGGGCSVDLNKYQKKINRNFFLPTIKLNKLMFWDLQNTVHPETYLYAWISRYAVTCMWNGSSTELYKLEEGGTGAYVAPGWIESKSFLQLYLVLH